MPTFTVVTRDGKKHSFTATTFQDLLDQVAMKFKQTEFTLVQDNEPLTALPNPENKAPIRMVLRMRRGREPSDFEIEVREAVHHPKRMERALKMHDFEGVFPEDIEFKGPKGQRGVLTKGPFSGGAKVFAGASKKRDAEKALQQRPVLVLFFMTGCPHCEANKPAWEEAKAQAPKGTQIVEVESSAVPDSEAVSGFPTMKLKKADGTESVVSGQKNSGKEILSELSGGGNRSLRRSHSRRNRKLRHRTLRNHVALRK